MTIRIAICAHKEATADSWEALVPKVTAATTAPPPHSKSSVVFGARDAESTAPV